MRARHEVNVDSTTATSNLNNVESRARQVSKTLKEMGINQPNIS